jgi:glycosyltransferase involved in cell wall biosynthesis
MRVAIVTDALDQPTRGNRTTIVRWMAHVRGVEIRAVPADPRQALDPVPDVLHGYHALHGGVAALALARRYGRPLVVSLGGTDLFACLKGDAKVADVLQRADCITGAFPAFGRMLEAHFGRALPYVTVPRGIVVPEVVRRPPHDGKVRALLPGGLRPAKDPLLALAVAERLVAAGLPLRLTILGPEMDRATARAVRERARGLPFVDLGECAPEAMGEAYAAADVVWNTSVYEGGANALLEAVAHGCAVFARDIPGNRELLGESGALGTLFDPEDAAGIEAFHRGLLAEDAERRRARVAHGRDYLREHHDPREEARRLEEVWRRVAD